MLPEKQRQRMLLHVVAPADDAHENEGKGEKQNKKSQNFILLENTGAFYLPLRGNKMSVIYERLFRQKLFFGQERERKPWPIRKKERIMCQLRVLRERADVQRAVRKTTLKAYE